MEEGEIEETQQQHEPLFKFLSDSCSEEGAPNAPNPKYEDGKVLPRKLRNRFLEEAKPCVPLEEIDPYFRNKQTFIVIGRFGTIHRFSSSPKGHFVLSPNNPVRRFAIYLTTNWIFSTFIVATLLLNIIALSKTQSFEIMRSVIYQTKGSWLVEAMYIVDLVCLAIYFGELVLKIIARGFAGDAFTCFRDPWTWLDVVVILTGFTNYSVILDSRSARWLRLFKLVPLIPSIRHAGCLSVQAVKRLGGILILGILFLWFFSLLGLQTYMGTLTQKCVKILPDEGVTDAMWAQHAQNMSNWYFNDGELSICGNASGSGMCPENYVCLQGFGKNPDFGYTNFDDIFWSLLSVLRISTDDYTEAIFRQVLAANGPWHILFFEALFLFITYPIGCLFFGILANFFKESKAPSELEVEELTGLAELHDFDNGQNPESLAVTKGKSLDNPEELVGFRKALHSFILHEWVQRILIFVILIDVYSITSYNYNIQESLFQYRLYVRIIPYAVFLLYTVEFILKIVALGPTNYFRDRWNHVDFIVLLTFFLEIQSYFGYFTGYMLAPIRMMKLIQYWPSLRMIISVYAKTIRVLLGWVLYTAIVCAFFVFIGPFEIGVYEREHLRVKDITTVSDLPRWSFIDFWHSFRMIVRAQIGEWIETLWDVLPYTKSSLLYYFLINTIGALLLSFLLIGVVYTSLNELQTNYDPSKDRGLRLLLRKAVGFLYFPIQRIQPRELIIKNGSESAENGADETGGKSKDGKDGEGGRRKKSIIAESTSQLRKVMQDCTEHWAYKIATSAVIAIASLAMIYETRDATDDLQTGLFVIEIVFTVIFFVVAVYELAAFGFRESIMNRGWVFDALIVLENILNLSVYQFSVTGPFLTGVFCIRAFRPLMLIARVDWLKAPFTGLKQEVKTIWETVLAIFFIWLFFDTFGVHWLAGLYYRCVDPEEGEEKSYNRPECLAHNMSWVNSNFNFDNSGSGFINMVFLVSRMGWIAVINGGSDAVAIDSPPQQDVSKFWLLYFILFVLMGGLGAMGILFSYVFKRFQDDKGYGLILTENQAEVYTETKNGKEPKEYYITLEDEYIPCPEAPCLQALFNFVTNQKFDAVVMGLIIFDNLCLSFDWYKMDETWEEAIFLIRLVVLVLFIGEMIVKMISWGQHYFRNAWNYLDLIVVLMGILDLFLSSWIAAVFISPALLRMFRLLRIFRFLLAKEWGLKSAKVLCSAVTNARHALGNLILLHLTIMWAYALLGNYLWANVVYSNGMLNDQINFKTFRHAFWTLALLLGFPGIDGLYTALSNEYDCEVKDVETSTCGDRTNAIFYIGTYIALTFLVLLNMYAVLISEIISELGRFNKDAKGDPDQEVPLEDVTTENGGGSNGDIGEIAEDGNSEGGE